ncbi:acyl-CoA dehydrogenase family protein [Bradyrhizobium genosp. L]|uniref:acyl-CoA dehydrogenase family protein n=1 Tax=Bradyrhizobium genosp. L TaxID=83637 RepID=UPI0018A292F5|nr:acyl-CoA dehydrogenase family protein [Bradyrhizobium genosp. L]QPF82564.1 acyl-CoA dehydrogenase family protein [Bradyrhizobium genosp. L]
MDMPAASRVADHLAALDRLAPLIAEQRPQFDRDRRLSDPVFQALAEAGMFRLYLPKALGGPEFSPLDFMTIVEAAAALDGSVGWLVGNGGGMSRLGGYLPEDVARSWSADPQTFVCSATGAVGTAVEAEGGYRVSGRWPFGSGAHHATKFMGLASVKGTDGKDGPPLCCYVDRSDVRIHDTWFVSGLRGTGSCDFEVTDVFVPFSHIHPLVDFKPTQPGISYRLPGLSAFMWTVSVVPLGIARGALDAFIALAAKKPRLGGGGLLRDGELVQSLVGRALAVLRSARALLVEAMTELMEAVESAGDRLFEARIAFRIACANAAEGAARIVEMIAAPAGTAAIFESGTLERSIRDVQAAVKHVAMTANSYTLAGRVSLGLPLGTTRF